MFILPLSWYSDNLADLIRILNSQGISYSNLLLTHSWSLLQYDDPNATISGILSEVRQLVSDYILVDWHALSLNPFCP